MITRTLIRDRHRRRRRLLRLTTNVAQAGGWAVVTVDTLPQHIVTGQAIDVGFTIRQHGRTLRDDLAPAIHFDRADGNASFTVTAKRAGGAGHYAATITFPSEGTWNWIVDTEQFGMISQALPTLMVSAAAISRPTTVAPIRHRPRRIDLARSARCCSGYDRIPARLWQPLRWRH